MRPYIRWSITGLLLLGCAQEPGEGPAARRSGMSLEAVAYSQFEGPLWPEAQRAVVLSAGGGEKEGTFVAYGVDVDQNEVRYALWGYLDEYPAFVERLTKEQLQPTALCRIGLGQVPIPLPPPDNPDGEPFREVLRRAGLIAADACP